MPTQLISAPAPSGGIGNAIFMFFVTVLAFAFGIFTVLNIPGMVIIGTYKLMFMPMMRLSQLWTFSLIMSVIMALIMYLYCREDWWKAYLLTCGVALTLGLVLHFGFLVEYPVTLTKVFFTTGSKKVIEAPAVKAETPPVPAPEARYHHPDPRAFAPIMEDAPALTTARPVTNLTPRN